MVSRRTSNLSKRRFLQGLGACVALPFMASLVPRMAFANEGDPLPPKRLLYYYTPNGFRMDRFTPEGAEKNFELSPILESLSAHKDDILVLSGLDNKPGNYITDEDEGGGAHFQQTASFLTAAHINKEPFGAGKSIDQVAAGLVGFDGAPYRSLQLGMHPGGMTGNCTGDNWPCAYKDFISWADETTPMVKEVNPPVVFANLFGGAAFGQSKKAFNKRKGRRSKVLDVVREDAKALQNKLGKMDKLRLEKYLTSVNETEDKVDAMQFGLQCDPGSVPTPSEVYTERLEVMLDIIALAFQCDLTRIISFMTHGGGATATNAYNWVNYKDEPIKETFHSISHHKGVVDNLGKIEAINKWEIKVFAGLLSRLKGVEEADGSTMLDNSIVFFSSECSDGNTHSMDNLPIIVAGGGQGSITPGRHLKFTAPNNCYADLHIGLVNAFGLPVKTFGDDGTKPLPGLFSG
jgi:hypothetical protein